MGGGEESAIKWSIPGVRMPGNPRAATVSVHKEADLHLIFCRRALHDFTEVASSSLHLISGSGVTTDPAMRGAAARRRPMCNMLIFWLTSMRICSRCFSLVYLRRMLVICSRPRLNERVWSMNCGPQPLISWKPCLTALFYCQNT